MSDDKESKVSDSDVNEKHSAYGKGFAMRMTILVAVLALVAIGLYYDRVVLPKKNKVIIEKAYAMMVKPDDGTGISKQEMQDEIGFAPSSDTTYEQYEVEKYTFPRALPFMPGDFLNVVYENGSLVQIFQNKEFSLEEMKPKVTVRRPDPETYQGGQRNIGVAGGGPPPADDDDDDDDDEEDDDEEEEDDEEGDGEDDSEDESSDEDGDG